MYEYEYIMNRIDSGVYDDNLELLKTDLLIIYGMLNRPQGEQVYNIALKHGSVDGYRGVLDLFHELVGLVKK